MIHTLAFCCEEEKKYAYFKLIWNRCLACRKVPALYHFRDADSFWIQALKKPVEGVLILLPETQGKSLFEELEKRCPFIKVLCFCKLEKPGAFSRERTFFPTPLTQERMEQALAWFDIVPGAQDDCSCQIFTTPNCLTAENFNGYYTEEVTGN